jgi:diguanylate cyclase (GGDEF)-like protein
MDLELTDYFAAVSAPEDEQSAIAVAMQRAADALNADVSAVVLNGHVRGCTGATSAVPGSALVDVVRGAQTLYIPELGELYAMAGGFGRDAAGALIVARSTTGFDADDRRLLSDMSQVLGLALRGIRVLSAERALREERERQADERLHMLDSLRKRQRLLETLLAIQRAISHRMPLSDILDSVTTGASDLLANAVVALVLGDRLEEQDDAASHLVIASTSGPNDVEYPEHVLAAAEAAMMADRVVIRPVEPEAPDGRCMIAAPVLVNGTMAGGLVAYLPGDVGQHRERRDLLAILGQQVSLALADARTVEAMREVYRDSLTGLPNRALFLDMLKKALGMPNRQTSVLFIDLDRFKAVNDSLGHKAGDDLLGYVAARIRGCLRRTDVGARLGSDEFAVLLDGTTTEVAALVADRIIAAIKEPFRVAGREVFIGASIGIASNANSGAEPGELLSNADVAMYRAKKDGPGKVVVFQPHMQAEVVDRLHMRGALQRALGLGELRLVYQPLVRLGSGEPYGMEALLRWTSAERGNVPPAEFIPIAEDSGLIIDIGRWILETAAQQLAIWRETFPDLTLNVNVSGIQLVDAEFASDAARALAKAGLPAEVLTLELTESTLMNDPTTTLPCLANLKKLGLRLAVDDFGTGYSSLSYLQQLPVDEVKIDRAFIARADLTVEDLAVVRTVVELSRALRLRTVAEGIENDAQLTALRELGCDVGQGYLLSRPIEAIDVPKFLTNAMLTAAA